LPGIDGQFITFTSIDAALPDLRYPVRALLTDPEDSERIVAAAFELDQVPLVKGELAFFLWEDASHPTRADYQYGVAADIGTCILKPHLRSKAGFANRTPDELVDLLFSA
jgi:hypothetical protein